MSNKSVNTKVNVVDKHYRKTMDAVDTLVKQGCGDPHFIPLMTAVTVTKSSLRDAVRDAHKNRYNQSLSNKGVREVLSVLNLSRGEYVPLFVFGVHGQFDYRSTRTKDERDRTFTTLPYQSVNLRCVLFAEHDDDMVRFPIGDLNHETLEFIDSATALRDAA